jgi:hypothetical protein
VLDVVFGLISSLISEPGFSSAGADLGGRRGARVVPGSIGGRGRRFLRILRTLRLLRSYQLLARLRADFDTFRRHEDIILACANFGVFLFVTTGFVYETQHAHNPRIRNYVDALYFTVAALTTTGFGDITLSGTLGRLMSIIIMIFGVTLFFGLARAVLIPASKPLLKCRKARLDGVETGADPSSGIGWSLEPRSRPLAVCDEPPTL